VNETTKTTKTLNKAKAHFEKAVKPPVAQDAGKKVKKVVGLK